MRSYKLIIAYHVYYDYYKIDRNKQSKITVYETDILNSHFTEHFYRQSRLTAVEQITFHDTKIKHFTRTNIDHSRLTKIPFQYSHFTVLNCSDYPDFRVGAARTDAWHCPFSRDWKWRRHILCIQCTLYRALFWRVNRYAYISTYTYYMLF